MSVQHRDRRRHYQPSSAGAVPTNAGTHIREIAKAILDKNKTNHGNDIKLIGHK